MLSTKQEAAAAPKEGKEGGVTRVGGLPSKVENTTSGLEGVNMAVHSGAPCDPAALPRLGLGGTVVCVVEEDNKWTGFA